MHRLQGKCVLVTGAARGIGFAIAKRFVQEGARVVLADRDAEDLDAASRSLQQPAIRADVSVRSEVFALIGEATALLGRIDVLVNNAGVYRSTPLLELTEAQFDEALAINLKSALFGVQAVAPQMIERRSGTIINIASVTAVLGSPGAMAYCVSKAGLMQLTNVAAIELAAYDVRVNAIGPGTIATDMARGAYADPDMQEKLRLRTPLGRMGTTEEVAGTALFLATEDSGYITGKTIFIDGGRLGLNLTM